MKSKHVSLMMAIIFMLNIFGLNVVYAAGEETAIFGSMDTVETFDSYSTSGDWIGASNRMTVVSAGAAERGKVLRFTGTYNNVDPEITIKAFEPENTISSKYVKFDMKFYNGTRCQKIRLVDNTVTAETTMDEMKTALELDLIDGVESSVKLNGKEVFRHERTADLVGNNPNGWFEIESVLDLEEKTIDYKFTNSSGDVLAEGDMYFVDLTVDNIASMAFIAYQGQSGACLVDDIRLCEYNDYQPPTEDPNQTEPPIEGKALKVACIGDSITVGGGVTDRENDSYPGVLRSLLKGKATVNNYGMNSRTVLKKGDYPYMEASVYTDSLAWEPDIVIIMLGTNDSKAANWVYKDDFVSDYTELIQSYKSLPSEPMVFINTPPTAYMDHETSVNNTVLTNEVVPAVKQAAEENDCEIIDVNSATKNMAQLFPDKVHPNEEGAKIIANTVYASLSPYISESSESIQTYYMDEPFDSELNGWENSGSAVQNVVIISEDDSYLELKAASGTVDLKKRFPTAIDCPLYAVEFDVKFSSKGCGDIKLYTGNVLHLGPTISFDGTTIKAQIGSSKYVTMYSNAKADTWYRIKMVADSTNKMFSYTTDLDNGGGTQQSSDSILRNLNRDLAGSIVITAASEQDPISVNNLKVYKPDPETIVMSAENDTTQVSVPSDGQTNTVVYSVDSVLHRGTDITDYDPVGAGIISFKLYDSDGNDLSENMPVGISLDPMSGVLTLTSDAEAEKKYKVCAVSYGGGGKAESDIEIMPQGRVESISFAESNPERIPVPVSGTMSRQFKVTAVDQYGSIIAEPDIVWSITDDSGSEMEYSGISIDQTSGIITAESTAEPGSIRIKATSADDPEISIISEPVEVYTMQADKIEIVGRSIIGIQNTKTVEESYTANIYDSYGEVMPGINAEFSAVDYSGSAAVSPDGTVTVPAGTEPGILKIKAEYGGISAEHEIEMYVPSVSKIEIDGAQSIIIPESGSVKEKYTAALYDQKGERIENEESHWSIEPQIAGGVSMSGQEITVLPECAEQTIALKAQAGDITETFYVVTSDKTYTYAPVKGGFEITNGVSEYSRPLYSSHVNDSSGGTRYIFYVGDKPNTLLSSATSSSGTAKYAHMFFGIRGGKWLGSMENITSRYVYGREEYEITDPSFDGEIRLTFVRPDMFDGLIVKAVLPESVKDKFTVAAAGSGGVTGSTAFDAAQTSGTDVAVGENGISITKGGVPTVSVLSNEQLEYSVNDASSFGSDVDTLISSGKSSTPMGTGITSGLSGNEVYFLITTEDPSNEKIQQFKTDPEQAFESGCEYFESLSKKVDVDTPDPYFNSTIAAQVIGMDASWYNKTIMHGPIAWFTPHAGWRAAYGETAAGFTDRVQTNAAEYFDAQLEDGRIPNFPTSDKRYNMGEVLVDQLLYNWLWDGDLEFMKNGGYDLIAKHLEYQDSVMKVPGTNLYESWLNAWNTDNKWENGGIGITATVYTWRAYDMMSDIAARLGKNEDSEKFREKADIIKAEMKETLWDSDTGVYGEYRDRFGLQRLHTAPDLSGIYTPIDVGAVDDIEAYQMLRYSEYAIDRLSGLPRDADFPYSSNWLPNVYSSRGLYPAEVINNALAYYQSGQPEKAYAQFKGVQTSLFKGKTAGPGLTAHMVSTSCENTGHVDFAEISSLIVRTAVEGTFGISMNMPDETVNITPGLNKEWKTASISTDYLSYSYEYNGSKETFNINSENALHYNMSIPARSCDITSVKVNGADVDYTVTSNIEFTTDKLESAVIEITYGGGSVPEVESSDIGAAKSEYTVKTDGIITEIIDPQGIISSDSGTGSSDITVTLADKPGDHSFFVRVSKGDINAVKPVDVNIKEKVEITDITLSTSGTPTLTFGIHNNTEETISLKGFVRFAGNETRVDSQIKPGETSSGYSIKIEEKSNITPGNNLIKADFEGIGIITAEYTDWELNSKLGTDLSDAKMVDLDGYVNQNLTDLHKNTYDITYEGDEHFVLPKFYFVSDTTRSVTANGRSWWEPGRGAEESRYTPVITKLPSGGGTFVSDIGVPFKISDQDGKNSVFVSLYNQFPDEVTIPVNESGSKLYFLLAVSTNNMQSKIENARITVNLKDGTSEQLPLINPDNIDDWLNYQYNPYAQSGYIQTLGSKGHSNILAVDLGENKEIESVTFTCLSNEVLAGLLGITVTESSGEKPLEVGNIELTADGNNASAKVSISNENTFSDRAALMIASYNSDGTLYGVEMKELDISAGSSETYELTYAGAVRQGGIVKAFLFESTNSLKPLTASETLK